jgi:serine phosphatase RsbU (regulator of sigma subunit)
MATINNSEFKLLVVDDTEANREVLIRTLTRQGYKTDEAENGQVALDKMANDQFDLVLLDIMMPVMNGFDTLENLKKDPNLRDIPVIIISAADEMDNIVRGIELGAEDYLPKPFNRVLLKARVGAILEKKHLRDQEQKFAKQAKKELDFGRQIQGTFLPSELPTPTNWLLAAKFTPAHEVAGDFYDAFTLPNDLVGIVMADVVDKGVGAALFMALTRSVLRVLAIQAGLRLQNTGGNNAELYLVQAPGKKPTDPVLLVPALTYEILSAVKLTNDYVTDNQNDNLQFATLFFGVVDTKTGKLFYVNAGHDAPVHLGSTGVKGRLPLTGTPVGSIPGMKYRVGSIQMEPGDLLFTYSDGVTEAKNMDSKLYGEDTMLELLASAYSNGPITPAALIETMSASVASHVLEAEPSDDITMLAAAWLPGVTNNI